MSEMRTRTDRGVGPAWIGLAGIAGLTGCGHSPNFNVLGSYFPGWIAAAVLAVLLTGVARVVLRRMDVERRLPMLPLFYLSLAVLFACVFWMLTFE